MSHYKLSITLLSDLCVSDGGVYNSSLDLDVVYDTFAQENQVGWWRGTFRNIENEEASAMHTFGMYSGRWKVISNDTERYRTGYIPTFRAYYVPFEYTTNWIYDSKFIYTEAGDGDDDHNLQVADPFPAEVFDSDLPDGYGEETGINPVIHTIDSDGTHRYFDMQGRQLKSRPSKGIYIDNGNKIIK